MDQRAEPQDSIDTLPRVLTDAEVRRVLRISRTTWYKWRLLGRGPVPLVSSRGGHPRYSRDVVLDWLRSNGDAEAN